MRVMTEWTSVASLLIAVGIAGAARGQDRPKPAKQSVVESVDVKARDKANTSGLRFPAVPAFDSEDPVARGAALARFADIFDRGWVDEVSRGRMTLRDAGGDSVRRTILRTMLENPKAGDKLVTKFLSPAEIKGVAALTHENSGSTDDNWLYLPANKRVRRISGANNTASFQGTEFTYEDLANLDYKEYEWRDLGSETISRGNERIPVYKLEAKPTYKDTGYSRLIVFFHRDWWRQERIEYFDKAGKKLKTRDTHKWQLVHGRFSRPLLLVMDNHQTGKSTEIEFSSYYVNLSLYKSRRTGKARKGLRESMFTTRALAK